MRRSLSFWLPFLFLQALIAMNYGCADGRGVENEHLNTGDELIFNFEESPTLSIKGNSNSWDKTFTEEKIAVQLNNYGAPNQNTCISLKPDWGNNKTEVVPGMTETTIDSDGEAFNQTESGMVEQLNNQTAIKANIDNTSYDISKMMIQGNLKTVVVQRNGKDPKTYLRDTLEDEVKFVNGKGYRNIVCTEQNVTLKLTLAKRHSISNFTLASNDNVNQKKPGDSSDTPAENGTDSANNNSAQKEDVLGNASAGNSSAGSADSGSAAAGGCSLQKAIKL